MDAKLIYSYLLFLAACLAASCAADISGGEAVNRGAELSFDASGLTRVSVTTGLDEFAVYGDMQLKDSAPTVIFNKTEVLRDSDSGKWYYTEPTQYWFPQHLHSFVAIAPVIALGQGSNPRYSNSALSFTYTLPDNFESGHDIVVSTHRRKMPEYSPSYYSADPIVRLKFFHIMSRINFRVKCDGAADKVTITKIEFERINKTGTFTITPAPLLSDSGQTDDYNISLTGLDKGTLTAGIDVDVANDNNTHPLFPDDNALFVVPQPDNKGIIMKITYKYDNRTGTEEQTLTAQEAIGGWEPGKLYLYSLTLDTISKEIYMTVSVKEWEPGSDNDVNVPRK